MRNGNGTGDATVLCNNSRSYRTYEEWKHPHHLNPHLAILCSYRTYEEWKHLSGYISQYASDCSYRTYEEWKP